MESTSIPSHVSADALKTGQALALALVSCLSLKPRWKIDCTAEVKHRAALMNTKRDDAWTLAERSAVCLTTSHRWKHITSSVSIGIDQRNNNKCHKTCWFLTPPLSCPWLTYLCVKCQGFIYEHALYIFILYNDDNKVGALWWRIKAIRDWRC